MNPEDCSDLGDAICVRLAAEIRKLGFCEETLPNFPVYGQAGFQTAKDPYSGQESLCGVWTNEQGDRIGEIRLHGDGSFYAEYDLCIAHPHDALWFVESVIAWGRNDVIKTEAKLLPALG